MFSGAQHAENLSRMILRRRRLPSSEPRLNQRSRSMTFASVDASGGGENFPQHPKTGDWETLKGSMLTPPLMNVLESSAMGDSRHIDEAPSIDWASTIIENTGCTPGGGTMAK